MSTHEVTFGMLFAIVLQLIAAICWIYGILLISMMIILYRAANADIASIPENVWILGTVKISIHLCFAGILWKCGNHVHDDTLEEYKRSHGMLS